MAIPGAPTGLVVRSHLVNMPDIHAVVAVKSESNPCLISQVCMANIPKTLCQSARQAAAISISLLSASAQQTKSYDTKDADNLWRLPL